MDGGEDWGYVPLAVVGKELSAGVGEGVGVRVQLSGTAVSDWEGWS